MGFDAAKLTNLLNRCLTTEMSKEPGADIRMGEGRERYGRATRTKNEGPCASDRHGAERASLGEVRADSESVATEELTRMNECAFLLAANDSYRTWEQGLRCDCCA